MTPMPKYQLSLDDYNKLINAFAQDLWLLRERWRGIKALRDVNKNHFSVWKKYHRFFDSVYRSFVYDFYVGICRLAIDDTKGVESMLKLLKKPAKNKPTIEDKQQADQLLLEEALLIQKIKKNQTLKKIEEQRNNFLAHKNSNLLFNDEFSSQFREENNPSSQEIDSLMNFLDVVLTKMAVRGSFIPLTVPTTSIRSEIEEIFSFLDKESKV
ncbi:MAG: hypothetical protein JSS32_07540 [Verrucomicrobia bacterium]|nr:hypothetical protein [Verrucomicrobiota bacterium]